MNDDDPVPNPADSPVKAQPARISSEELLGGRREIIIQHGTEQYRLRLTNNDKLILVK
jgi:hemin uptake protein HemP